MSNRIRVLGVGGLLSGWPILNSNYVIESDGKRLLLDCGMTIQTAFQTYQICPSSIDAIFISHMHPDHVGGLPWLAFEMYYKHKKRPLLFILDLMCEELWDGFLKVSLVAGGANGALTLGDFFEVQVVRSQSRFFWNGVWFSTKSVLHVVGDTLEASMDSNALLMCTNGSCTSVLFSTDIADECRDLEFVCGKADVIIHDCDFVGKSGVHPSYRFLRTLPADIRGKMWLTHYARGDAGETFPDVKKDGFRGLLQQGQIFEID